MRRAPRQRGWERGSAWEGRVAVEVDAPICPACQKPLLNHWQCAWCHCLGHENVQARRDKGLCQDCEDYLTRHGVRRCTGCGAITPIAPKSWGTGKCAACRSAYRKAYYAKNRAREAANNRAWQESNRDKLLARRKRFRQRHRARLAAQQRAARRRDNTRFRAAFQRYYDRNRAALLAKGRERWKQNRERFNAAARLRRQRKKLAFWTAIRGGQI